MDQFPAKAPFTLATALFVLERNESEEQLAKSLIKLNRVKVPKLNHFDNEVNNYVHAKFLVHAIFLELTGTTLKCKHHPQTIYLVTSFQRHHIILHVSHSTLISHYHLFNWP
jgi:hypothetical protein